MTASSLPGYFELFQLMPGFALDTTVLESRYRDVQSRVHPDKHAHLSSAEQRVAMQWATLANEAYRALKSPLTRAEYLLKLNGVDPNFETNTAMPTAFLMQQMEWREAIAEARAGRDVTELERLSRELRGERVALIESLGHLLDTEQDYEAAAREVRKLKFLEKLDEDIGDALDAALA